MRPGPGPRMRGPAGRRMRRPEQRPAQTVSSPLLIIRPMVSYLARSLLFR